MMKMSDDELAAAQAESNAIDAIEGDDPPMHFRADGSLHTGLTGVPQDRSDDGVPEFEQCDDCESTGQNCWVHGGRERSWGRSVPARCTYGGDCTVHPDARGLHDFDNVPASTLADDVAALRAAIGNYGGLIQDWRDDRAQHPGESEYRSMVRTGVAAAWKDIEARLDRIAGAVPQRAMNEEGVPIWLHECGSTVRVLPETGDAPCRGCRESGSWQALYTLGGAAMVTAAWMASTGAGACCRGSR